jgi:hypothetical protein
MLIRLAHRHPMLLLCNENRQHRQHHPIDLVPHYFRYHRHRRQQELNNLQELRLRVVR